DPHPFDFFGRSVKQGLAGTNRRAHRLLSDAGAVEAHVALHHLVDLSDVVRHSKRAGQNAVRTTDASRLERAVNDAVFRLLDRIGRAHAGARRIFAMHADDRRRLRAEGPVHKLEMDHRPAAMRVALHARLHAGLAADASRGIDEELEAVHTLSTFSTRHA